MGQILSFGPSAIRARRRKPRSMFYDQGVSSNKIPAVLNDAIVRLQPSGIEDTAGNVTAWRNSGTGGSVYDLSAPFGTVTNVAFSGLPSVEVGLDSGLRSGSLVNVTLPVTICAVIHTLPSDLTSAYYYLVDSYDGTVACGVWSRYNRYQFFANVAYDTNFSAPDNGSDVVVAVLNGANSSFYCNSGSVSEVNPGNQTILRYITLLGYRLTTTRRGMRGCSDFAMFDRVLSVDEISKLRRYWKALYKV